MDLDEEESAPKRVARLITRQVVARGSSSPDSRKKPIRQSPRLSSKSDKSAGSDMIMSSGRHGLWANPADSKPLGKWPGTESASFN